MLQPKQTGTKCYILTLTGISKIPLIKLEVDQGKSVQEIVQNDPSRKSVITKSVARGYCCAI